MTMREAAALAEKLWSQDDRIGVVKRRRSSKVARFLVGVAYLDGRRSDLLGSSNVSWECAFMNAAFEGHYPTTPEFDPNQEGDL